MMKKQQKLFEKLSAYLLFTSLFFYFLIWIPQGLDITDEGYSFTKGWFSLHGGWKDNVDIIWMSSLINGLWLSIVGEPSVIWGRIGYAITISLTSVITFSILKLYFKTVKTFIVVFLVTILYAIKSFMSISYYILPVLLVLLSIYLLIKFISSRNNLLLFGAGFIIGILGFVKCTFFLTPVLYLFYLKIFLHAEKKELKPIVLFSLAGLSSGYLFGILILIFTGSLKIFINELAIAFGLISNPFPSYGLKHSISNLLIYYSENFYQLFYFCMAGINILFVFLLSISYLKTGWWRILVSILFIYFIYSFAKKGDSQQWEYVVMTFGFTYLFLKMFDTKSNEQLSLIILFSLIIFVLSFLGSGGGLVTGFQSGGMLLLLSVSVLIGDDISLDPSSLIKLHSFKYLKYIFLGFLVLVLIWKKPDDAYRERPRNELRVAFHSTPLLGLFSHQQRVNSLDSLIIAYEKIKRANSTSYLNTLAINSNPMFYYLVNNKPYLCEPWGFSILSFDKTLQTKPKPDIFVFSMQNPRNVSWPMNNSKPCEGLDSLDFNYFMNYVLKNNYMSAYKNKMFQIYAKPDLLFRTDTGNILLLNNKTNQNQTPDQWEKLRPNCTLNFDYDNSSTIAFEITNFLEGGTGGIFKSVLIPDSTYFVTARIKSDFPAKIILQAGGGISQISYQLTVNTWVEAKGFLKASGNAFIIYADNMPVDGKLFVSGAGVFKTSIKQ